MVTKRFDLFQGVFMRSGQTFDIANLSIAYP